MPLRPSDTARAMSAATCVRDCRKLSASKLRWATHRAPINPADSGWHFLAIDETDQTMADSNNFTLVALDDVIRIEPAVAMIVHLPVGADLGLDPRGATPVGFDAVTGTPI